MVGITKLRISAIRLGVAIFVGATLFAATPAFANRLSIQIPGINSGNPIPIISYDMSESSGNSSANSGAGRSNVVGSVTVTKKVDNSSPALLLAMNNGKFFATVTINDVNPARQRTIITMRHALISSLNQSGSGRSVQTETLTFQFQNIATSQSVLPRR